MLEAKHFYSLSNYHEFMLESINVHHPCNLFVAKFYIMLTVHLVMILGKWPTWRKILFYAFISLPYTFRAISCSSSGESIVSIQHLVYVTKRSPTHSDIYQMLFRYNWFSWWWARGCSKHVKVKVIPQQAEGAQGVPGKLRPRIFLTFGNTRVVGRQP